VGSEGNLTELGELIADDKAIDLADWLDAKTFLSGCPQRLIGIGLKRLKGIPLDGSEQRYLNRYQKKYQLTLF